MKLSEFNLISGQQAIASIPDMANVIPFEYGVYNSMVDWPGYQTKRKVPIKFKRRCPFETTIKDLRDRMRANPLIDFGFGTPKFGKRIIVTFSGDHGNSQMLYCSSVVSSLGEGQPPATTFAKWDGPEGDDICRTITSNLMNDAVDKMERSCILVAKFSGKDRDMVTQDFAVVLLADVERRIKFDIEYSEGSNPKVIIGDQGFEFGTNTKHDECTSYRVVKFLPTQKREEGANLVEVTKIKIEVIVASRLDVFL